MIGHLKSKFPELFTAVLSGVVVGIVVSNYNFDKTSREKDASIISLFEQELLANEQTIKANQVVLSNDIELRAKGISIVNPLNLVRGELWEIMKLNLPKKIATNKDVLIKIRYIDQMCDEINSTIESRESFRITNEGRLPNFETRMKQYDIILLEKNTVLYKAIQELRTLV